MRRKTKGSIGEKSRKILPAFFMILVAGICSCFFYQLMLIQGESMEPSYHNMQLVVLNKIDRLYQLGDVIAFQCKELNSVLVKRIVAGEGDTAYIRNGTLYVNGVESLFYPPEAFLYSGLLEEPIQLGKGEYLVIGDNLSESRDSRYPEVGVVKIGTIIGKICR